MLHIEYRSTGDLSHFERPGEGRERTRSNAAIQAGKNASACQPGVTNAYLPIGFLASYMIAYRLPNIETCIDMDVKTEGDDIINRID